MIQFKLTILGLIFTICSIGIFSSCSNDDGYSLGDMWLSKYATVNNMGEPIKSLTIGDSTILTVIASNFPYYISEEPRVTINYTILGDQPNGHLIKLNGIAEIPTKMVEDITVDNIINITNDPVNLKTLTVSHQYVNIDFEFMYGGNSAGHSFDLYRITQNEYKSDNDTINLEFRHNKNGDTDKWLRAATRCYNLRSLELEKYKKFILKIKLNTPKGDEYIYREYIPF